MGGYIIGHQGTNPYLRIICSDERCEIFVHSKGMQRILHRSASVHRHSCLAKEDPDNDASNCCFCYSRRKGLVARTSTHAF